MKLRLLLAVANPLATTGAAILLQVIFPRLHASAALFVAGFGTTLACLWVAEHFKASSTLAR